MNDVRSSAIALALSLIALAFIFGAYYLLSPREGAVRTLANTIASNVLQDTHEQETHAQMPFLEITEGCNAWYGGTCYNMRSGPSTEYPVVQKLRIGMVLQVEETVTNDAGEAWHKIAQNEWLRYPERMTSQWYVIATSTLPVTLAPDEEHLGTSTAEKTKKRIDVSRGRQELVAYDGDEVFMRTPISTGLDLTPTPRGYFKVFKKTPSRYMQGPLPPISDQFYDLPGVPWNLYFTNEGGAIHGAYWHESFGEQRSHGCVNLPLDKAKELYFWAPLGTEVFVHD